MAVQPSAKVFDIDSRKHRKSTHLASADLEMLQGEGRRLVFTIKSAWYQENVNVSGESKAGYFCEFVEPGVKDLMLNSVNRNQIVLFCKQRGLDSITANNVKSWVGMTMEFYVDNKVKMMNKIVDGIRISPILPTVVPPKKKEFTEDMFAAAKENGNDVASIKKSRTMTKEVEEAFIKFLADNG